MKDETLSEAKRLYDLGFAILWLHPKEKRPIGSGWTTGERKKWAVLLKEYRPGMNVGVRTGSASHLKEGYLTCIDVDVKHPEFEKAALTKIKELVGDAILPEVKSG